MNICILCFDRYNYDVNWNVDWKFDAELFR